MSLTKLLKAPIKLFKKEIISFVIIRRFDLGIREEKFRFICVRSFTSISSLRHKVWRLLDLPDFCEEIIVLKSEAEVVIPLTDLKKGNDPQHPYIMEVYLPGPRSHPNLAKVPNNKLLTIENGENHSDNSQQIFTHLDSVDYKGPSNSSLSMISNETKPINKIRLPGDDKTTPINGLSDFKKSELSCRLSSSSIFRLTGRKNSENFTTLLLKMQSELSTLTNKLASLENRILT